MYICRWFVLCETVVFDHFSSNLTMVNAITELHVPSFPGLYPRFAFASLLEKQEESKGPLSLRFVRENESGYEVLLTIENNIEPIENKIGARKAQFFMNFPLGIRLLNEGKITFHIEAREGEADWYPVGSQNIQVSLTVQQGVGVTEGEREPR